MGKVFNLGGVVDPKTETEVEHGKALLAYADAIYENDSIALTNKREQVLKAIGPSGLPRNDYDYAALGEVRRRGHQSSRSS